MSINTAHEDSVLVSLSTTTPDNVSFPERRIVLTESQPRMNIGRSSNRTTLGLFPMLSNGWFDSPVMSRHHAEIEADLQRQVVKIRDAGSMHGTYLNDEKLGSDEARPVVAGDKITFGMPVYRNQTIFKPATMTVDMEFRNAARANNSPSRVFTVPDDCSTDENFEENEPIDDDLQHGMSSMQGQQDIPSDEEQENRPPEIRQIDGAVEIGSDCAPNDLISISSDEEVEGDEVRHDDDDESISLTDDEEMSSAPASPIESIDLGDTVQTDNDMDEDCPSNRAHSDDEQGVFLYGSDSEEMGELDDVDPIDTDFDRSTQTSPFFSVPSLTGCTAPVLPSLSAAVFSQPHFPDMPMPFAYQLPPVVQSIPRQPSPSDAVLPLSHRHHGSEDDGAMTVENLGRKWGKPDFFEAREHNKITISRLTDPVPSLEAGLVPHAATKTPNDASAEDKCLRTLSNDSQDHVASSAIDTGKQNDSKPPQVISQVEASGQNASRPVEAHERFSQCLESHAPQSPKAFEPAGNPSLLESGADFLKSPLHEAPAMNLATTEVVEALDWTPASAYELQEYKQQNQAQKEQDLEASRDLMDHLSINHSIGKPKDRSVNKRKAEEISEATQQELVWHDNGSSMPPFAPGTPAGQSEPKADVSLPSPPTTPQGQDRVDARPSKKIRKIAERVGYAALGGATVGAMVFTSLIYTAPSFA